MADRMEQSKSNVSNETISSYGIELERAQREIDEATGKKRNIIKRAQESGVNTKALLSALNLKKKDEEKVQAELRDEIRYCNIVAPSLKLTQASLFDQLDLKPLNDKTAARQQEWEVEQAGYQAGRDGGNRSDNTYAAGTPHHASYDKGWLRGQATIAAELGKNAENVKVADASKAKPKRGAQPETAVDEATKQKATRVRRGKAAAADPDEVVQPAPVENNPEAGSYESEQAANAEARARDAVEFDAAPRTTH